jgi:hypothetical protein
MASADTEITLEKLRALPSFILICHYYPAYDLEKAGKLNCLQIQILLQEFS